MVIELEFMPTTVFIGSMHCASFTLKCQNVTLVQSEDFIVPDIFLPSPKSHI